MNKNLPFYLLRSMQVFMFIAVFHLDYHAQAQSSGSTPDPFDEQVHCGASPMFFYGGGYDSTNNTNNLSGPFPANSFPSNAIITCGRFKVYYEDMTLSYQQGFADPIEGPARRATMCAVLSYIEGVFNFGNMPANNYIRILVNKSLVPGNFPSPPGTGWYAKARPGFHLGTTSGLRNGWVYDYATTGLDPTGPDQFHAELYVNFDQVYSQIQNWSIDWLSDYTMNVDDCQIDLYSVLLHEVTHMMGMYTLINATAIVGGISGAANYTPLVTTANIFTGLDFSLYVGNNSNVFPTASLTKFVNGTLSNPTLNTTVSNNQANRLWLNNLAAPQNYPMFSGNTYTNGEVIQATANSYICHFGDQFFGYSGRERVSPGENQKYVMGPFGIEGMERRTYTKADIKALRGLGNGSMGYQLTTTFTTNNPVLLNNTPPHSSKMAGSSYANYDNVNFCEMVAADFPPLANNTGAYIDINVSQDVNDPDVGDVISVMPNTLINFRGCGTNGNNHDCLTILNNGQTIRFNPRANFVGRAQFGFNVWDGKERGSFVLYTIDVVNGNDVQYTAGTTNMLVNGDNEEGSEVATLGALETLPNAVSSEGYMVYEGKLARGSNLSDGQPYSIRSNEATFGYGTIVHNSMIYCNTASNIHYTKGGLGSSWPMLGFYLAPDADVSSGGERYQKFGQQNNFSFYNLKASAQNCKRYILTYKINPNGNPNTNITIGFANSNTINWPQQILTGIYVPNLIFSTTSQASPGVGTWQGVTKTFWYCGSNSDLMYIKNNTTFINNDPLSVMINIDNLVLVEDLNPPAMTVSIAASGACNNLLTANVLEAGCSPTYQWYKNGVLIAGATQQTYIVNSMVNASYTVTVHTTCNQTATSPAFNFNTNVNGSCNTCTQLGTSTPTELGSTGTISSSPAPGYYYIANTNINISGGVTFTNSVVYIGPGVTINVDNGDVLTIDHSHFFGCDQMWNGIRISGTGKFSAINDALIEDAMTAVKTVSPVLTGGVIISTNNATFNRNHYCIDISGLPTNSANYFAFKNTVFTCRDLSDYPQYPFDWWSSSTLKSPTTGSIYESPYSIKLRTAVACKDTDPGMYGVLISAVGSNTGTAQNPVYDEIVIGSPATGTSSNYFNLFDNLYYGIYSQLSCFASVNNVFMSIKGDASSAGIYGIGASTGQRARVYTPTNSDQPNKFYDCTFAVNIKNYSEVLGQKAEIRSSRISTTSNVGKFGYRLSSDQYRDYTLADNKIYNVDNGIYISAEISNNLQAPGAINVSNNNMGSNIPGNTETTRWMGNAITIENLLPCTTCPYTGNLDVLSNNIATVYNGIRIAGFAQNSTTKLNNISLKLQTPTASQYGIKHSNSRWDNVYTNTVTGFDNSDHGWRAVFSENNTNYNAMCNTVLNTGRGFDFIGNTVPVKWMGNDMTNNGWSMALEGVIGHQQTNKKPMENRWLTQGTFTYVAAVTPQIMTVGGTTNQLLSGLWAHPTALENPTQNYSTPYNTNTIYSVGNGIGTTSVYPAIGPCPTPPIRRAVVSGVILVVGSQVIFGNYKNTAGWIAQYNLWQSLVLDSNIVDEDTLGPPGLLDEFKAMGRNSRFGMLAQIDSLLAEGDTAAARSLIDDPTLLSPLPDSSALGVMIHDDSLVNPVIENHIKFYQLYLNYKDGSFSSADSLTLDSLANLCFMKDGDAVLQARVLYSMIYDPTRTFENNCPADEEEMGEGEGGRHGQYAIQPFSSTNKGAQKYSLVPNPNNGNFTIQQMVADERRVDVEVWNALGSRVYKNSLIFRNKKAEIKLNNVSPGNYLLKLNDINGNHSIVKFTVL